MPRRKKSSIRGKLRTESNGSTPSDLPSIILKISRKKIKTEDIELPPCNLNEPIGNGELNPHDTIHENDELRLTNNTITVDVQKPVIKIEDNLQELRRTSRRIVPKTKVEFPINPAVREKKFKRLRKNKMTENSINGAFKRGPGRPRKVPFPNWHSLPLKSDPDSNGPVSTSDNHVWTLVPRTLVDSEFFKSHIIQMRYPRQPPNALLKQPNNNRNMHCPRRHDDHHHHHPSIFHQPPNPHSDRRRIESLFNCQGLPFERRRDPRREEEEGGSLHQKSPASTRPTVIYFRPAVKENGKGDEEPIINKGCWDSRNRQECSRNFPKSDPAICGDERAFSDYACGNLRESCSIQSNEERLNAFPCNHPCAEENGGYCKIIRNPPCANISTEVIRNYNEEKDVKIEEAAFLQKNPRTKFEVDTLCRQVIVDSLKVLYSEESVLG